MGHSAASATGIPDALDALVRDLTANRTALASLQAREAELLASAVDIIADRAAAWSARGGFGSDLPLREVSAELAAALRMSDRTVQGRIGDAALLVNAFAATLDAWRTGEVDARQVGVILDAGALVCDEGRTQFEQLCLDAAQTESAARLRPIAQVIAATIDPEGAQERLRHAQSRRSVRVMNLGDGMARLLADLPAALAYAILDRLTLMARDITGATADAADVVPDATQDDGAESLTAPTVTTVPGRSAEPDTADADEADAVGDTTGAGETGDATDAGASAAESTVSDLRTVDELRADILADMLLAATPTAHGDGTLGAIRGQVHVTVPALTLAGVGDEPALLNGYGPIDSDTARGLAGGAEGWERVFTDPCSGAPVAVDRYRPSAQLSRFLKVRDEHCRFPACNQPIWRCDLDHTIDAALGGPTRVGNLAHLCRRHHILKHNTAWTVVQRPGGVLEWTSPTGRVYADRPASTVRFVPEVARDGDPPPF